MPGFNKCISSEGTSKRRPLFWQEKSLNYHNLCRSSKKYVVHPNVAFCGGCLCKGRFRETGGASFDSISEKRDLSQSCGAFLLTYFQKNSIRVKAAGHFF
jgi:hypothetical protein